MSRGQVPETRNCTSRQGHSGPRGKARFGFGLESQSSSRDADSEGHPPHAASRTRLRRLALDLDDGAVL